MKYGIKIFLSLCLSLVLVTSKAAGDALRFTHITVADGLSNNDVEHILQDRSGFMWFGTDYGLNRYDGYQFVVFIADANNPNSLSNNTISTIYEDIHNIIWIGTDSGGLNRFDPYSNSFKNYQSDSTDPTSISHNSITSISEDFYTNLWIGTDNGLNLFNRETEQFVHFWHEPNNPESISANDITALFLTRSGGLWVGTKSQGLNRLNLVAQPIWVDSLASFSRYHHDPNNPKSISENYIRIIYEDRSGQLWIGTDEGGLNWFDPETGSFTRYQHQLHNSKSLSYNQINSILEDQDGTLWVGTDNGLNILNRQTGEFTGYFPNPHNPNGLNNNEIESIYQDRSGMLWFGTDNGLNLLRPRGQLFQLFPYDPQNGESMSHPDINALWEDEQGLLWLGTDDGLNSYHRKTGRYQYYYPDPTDPFSISGHYVTTLIEDHENFLWIGTNNFGLDRFDRTTGQFQNLNKTNNFIGNSINALFEDHNHQIWIGTDDGLTYLDLARSTPDWQFDQPRLSFELSHPEVHVVFENHLGELFVGTAQGLNRVNATRTICRHYLAVPEDSISLSNDNIQAIFEDPDYVIWIGTNGGGLNSYYPQHDVFHHYTSKDGLAGNVVFGILQDEHNQLWLSTNRGLSCFHKDSKTFRNYDTSDGLLSSGFNPRACFKNHQQEMIFGTVNGFMIFHPDSIVENLRIPEIAITGFKLFGEPYQTDCAITYCEEIELNYQQNFFSFEFAVLDYAQKDKNQYTYQLVGVDPNWVNNGNLNVVNYTNVPPGNYLFRVKGSNSDGVWNLIGAGINIKILPPFWDTWWFNLLEFIIIVLVIFFILIFQQNRLKDKLEHKRKSEELERARSIQLSLIPKRAPDDPDMELFGTMKTAEEVGGDYFDFIPDPTKDRVYIAIGDVSGKGAPASMLMVETRAIFRSQITIHPNTKDILVNTNYAIYPDIEEMKSPMFITVMLMFWDRNEQLIRYTGAGHEHIIHFRYKKKACDVIKSGGICLGIVDTIEYVLNENKLKFEPGDVILLYTDGVTEYLNNRGEMFGLERLPEFLVKNHEAPAEKIGEALLAALAKFGNGAKQHDDVTFVVMKRKKTYQSFC